jgi:hypothetical protein
MMSADTPDDPSDSASDSAAADAPDQAPDESPLTADIQAALREVRHEGYKVAFIYAVADAVLVALLAAAAVGNLTVPGLPETLPLPGAVAAALGRSAVALPVAYVVAAVAGLSVLVGEFVWRTRRPMVERFESANPEIREALRTARDAVVDGDDTTMARRLYADVLERLRSTSSIALLDTRRLAVTILLITVVSMAGIQLTVTEVSLSRTDPPDNETSFTEYQGLQDGEAILGEETNVTAGSQELNASVGATRQGEQQGGGTTGVYDSGGLVSDTDVQSQQAGFSSQEDIEDAALIREYNLRVRQ